ncbi:MAG: hypothetical protein ACR2P0_17115, partial [Acidimicrobiales bacterium]
AIRLTRIRENVQWVADRVRARGNSTRMPTHCAMIGLSEQKVRWRHTFDAPRLDTVFSIHAL